MRKLGLCFLLLATGCQKDPDAPKSTSFSEQKSLPTVALVPIFDRTDNTDLSWSLSNELTTSLRRRLAQKEKLALVTPQKVKASAKKLEEKHDPFAVDISWMSSLFKGNQFVVFVELLEHQEVPTQNAALKNSSVDLNMRVKVRVVDMRGQSPKIVLQEILHESDSIPKQFTKAHFDQVAWGQDNFHATPIGLAHAKLIKGLAKRIEDYVLLASKKG
jgi:hypothetical protein